jgi:hypothetical protein
MTRGLGAALGVALASALYTAGVGVSGASVAQAPTLAAGHGLSLALGVLGLVALATGIALLLRRRAPEGGPPRLFCLAACFGVRSGS